MPSESWPAAAGTIEVKAPARLHFGLLAPAAGQPRRYGGVGVMLRPPRLRLRLEAAPRFQPPPQEELARRIEAVAQRLAHKLRWGQLPPVRMSVPEAVPLHVGLGAGTQLALAAAWGLLCWQQGKPVPRQPHHLAEISGRGRRSAIGVHGFCRGGWIVEPGKKPGETLSPLRQRLENPRPWRWLLLRPELPPGRTGAEEQQIFQTLPPSPRATERLRYVLHQELVPAVQDGRFEDAAQALGRYSRIAGEPFSAVQGGPYAHRRVQQLIEQLHCWGYAGAGQSSWGPTVFVLLPNEQAADELLRRLQRQWAEPLQPLVAATDFTGAEIRFREK